VVAGQRQDRDVGGEFGLDLLVFLDLAVVGEVAGDKDCIDTAAVEVVHDAPGAGQRALTAVQVGIANMRDDHHAVIVTDAAPSGKAPIAIEWPEP
jgi:hypothetical protein